MLADAYPDPGELQRLRVHVPDRPGVLAGITQALGAERINIEDFELHHVSPRARRHADAARRAARTRRSARRRCSRRRATASSSRLCSARVKIDARRPRCVGHIAVPGRQVDLASRGAARRDRATGETRVRGFGRSGDTESTIAAVRALGVDGRRGRRRHAPRPRRRACAACARPASRSTAATPGTLVRLLAGILAGQRGPLRAGRRRVAARAGRWSASPSRSRGWARGSRRPTARRRSSIEGGELQRDPLRAAGRERAGEVVRPARRALRATGRRPSSSRCRRATTPS